MNAELGSVISVTCWDIFACFHFQSVPSRFNPSLWRNSLQFTSVNHQFAAHIVTLCIFSRRPFISNQVDDSQLVGDLVFLCDFHRPVLNCTYIASEKSSVRNFHVYSPIYCFDSELCNCFTEVVRGGRGDNFSNLTIVQFLFAPSQLSGVWGGTGANEAIS